MDFVNVFISHAEEERHAARALMQVLPEAGARSFSYLFTPPPPGIDFPTYLAGAIDNAHIVVFLWSQAAANSHWMAQEVMLAQQGRKIIVPVMLENLPLPPQLGRTQAIRAFENPSGWVLQVRNAVAYIKQTAPLRAPKRKGLFGRLFN